MELLELGENHDMYIRIRALIPCFSVGASIRDAPGGAGGAASQVWAACRRAEQGRTL